MVLHLQGHQPSRWVQGSLGSLSCALQHAGCTSRSPLPNHVFFCSVSSLSVTVLAQHLFYDQFSQCRGLQDPKGPVFKDRGRTTLVQGSTDLLGIGYHLSGSWEAWPSEGMGTVSLLWKDG